MKRPVWLFSMDSEQFSAAPITTGGLKAYYHHYGQRADSTEIIIEHFLTTDDIEQWRQRWLEQGLPQAQQALAAGQTPIAGFSVYTWNAAEFLELMGVIKASCPEVLILTGGPHVQQAADYLLVEPVDIVVLGEGEATFQELLDCDDRADWHHIQGLAFVENGSIVTTSSRPRRLVLDELPSALEVIDLVDSEGKPLYESIAYETSRGCPFSCAFCEWGTGALGTKMYQFSMERIRQDWEAIIAAGIKDIWLADSNFGALKEDVEKTRIICELKERTGLPSTFATSWSKKHSPKVQEIVMMLNRHGLLPHYQLALQTLTPLALELSNRKNMAANKYEPIAKDMAEQGIPIAAELIWGLPGDNLPSFEANLDTLLATFPNINIFGYTLLPGTEFYRRREEYQIKSIPVAGYGKAKGEYVVGCHTFDVNEGIEGYFLITAHIILIHGHLMPLTVRYLSLEKSIPVSPLLRRILRALVAEYVEDIDALEIAQLDLSNDDKMTLYENRAALYLALFDNLERTYRCIRNTTQQWLMACDADTRLFGDIAKLLQLDAALCPRQGPQQEATHSLAFDAHTLSRMLHAMDLPTPQAFATAASELQVRYPGGVGSVLKDPDGGSWLCGEIIEPQSPVQTVELLELQS